MIEKGLEPNIILGRIQRKMDNINIVDQGASSSKKNEEKKPRSGENQAIGGGLFKGTISDVNTYLFAS